MRIFALTCIMLGTVLSAQSAAAASGGSGSVHINAYVPEVCDIAAESFTLDNEGVVVGTVQEFCNTSAGFQVVASHRPLAADETASIAYGGFTAALGASGLAAVAYRSGQRVETVPVQISAASLNRPLSIAFSLFAV